MLPGNVKKEQQFFRSRKFTDDELLIYDRTVTARIRRQGEILEGMAFDYAAAFPRPRGKKDLALWLQMSGDQLKKDAKSRYGIVVAVSTVRSYLGKVPTR